MKLDRFDILMTAAAVALFSGSVYLAAAGGEAGTGGMKPARASAMTMDAITLQRLQTARLQLESGQARESMEALKALAAEHPTCGDAHALLGQAYSRLLDYPSAVREYRMALLIDPDYVDGKSDKFIGKRIKATVRDCRSQVRDAVGKDPDDEKAAATLADALYLERMLAGGCE